MMEKIVIYRNRKQLALAVAACMGFVLSGVFLLTRADIAPMGHAVALVAAIFFGSCAFAGGLLLFRKKNAPVLVLNPEGLTLCNFDHSRRQIPWRRITGFESREWRRETLLLIHVDNPDETVAAETNPAYRKILLLNRKLLGTPYCITPSALHFPKGELLPALEAYHRRYRC